LRRNRNYRYTWLGQVVSETGDYFNNIAVFSLVMALSGSGLVVSGVMLSRAIPAVLAGPMAGVALDRFDRRATNFYTDCVGHRQIYWSNSCAPKIVRLDARRWAGRRPSTATPEGRPISSAIT
jgi:MFS family permease